MALQIVIVTYNWPPRNAIGAHRPYAWARHWRDAGAEVVVLTAKKQAFDAPLDLQLPPLEGVEVIEIDYGQAASLRSRALSALLTPLMRSKELRRLLRKAKGELSNAAARLPKTLRREREGARDPRAGWLKASLPEARVLASRADIVVSTFGPEGSHLIAHAMKDANPSLFWVADYRDLWSQNHAPMNTGATRERAHALETRTVGASADLLTGISVDMSEKLRAITQGRSGAPTFCSPNGFDLEEERATARLRSTPTPAGKKGEGPLRIIHTGMIYEGRRDPTPLLLAIHALHEEGLIREGDLSVDFYGERIEAIHKLARDPRFSPFVRALGHVTHAEILKIQQEADVLLLLAVTEEGSRGSLTGKLFEYLVAGRPILCVGGRPDFEIAKILSATGTGKLVPPDQITELKALVLQTLGGEGLSRLFSPKVDEVLKYSRRRQALALLEEIKRLRASS